MQFAINGPNIPDELLQAHEEGRVVFFCGAGISYPAGLPGFEGLVDEIYRLVGTTLNPIEQDAYLRNQYDATLDLLERRLPGQRLAVRKALMEALQPKWRRKGATDTHAALLQLARNSEGTVRLVTTNFDRIFERIAKRTKQQINAYPAPLLPIPKNSRWNGLVYLHGLLPEHVDDSALNRLVLTSGDFGLAYLTERWAARFVSELFRNYVVCFVGYRINDPVLRYMMDALAADRMLGEVTPQAYALGDCEPGQENTKTIEWEAKGVAPILYEVPTGTRDHSALHRTLKNWAETYRDGILGKERIVVDYAMARPSASTRQDDFVGRMLWALSHESGLPAKRFADFDPVPPLDWLEAFSKDRYQHRDLERFGVTPRTEADYKLGFSLIRRPEPYALSPWMLLVSGGAMEVPWDGVMLQLARWLVRHLNDPVLILWMANRGGQLHDQWTRLIENELDRFTRLEREENKSELEEILSNAPNANPRPLMRVLWRLLLTGRVKTPRSYPDIYGWTDRLKRDGMTTTLRLELRELLTPKIAVRKPFRWTKTEEEGATPENKKQLIDWELVLATDHVHQAITDLAEDRQWRNALPLLLDDFQQLLRDALDLLCELSGTDDRNDPSSWDLPSICPHWQNRHFQDWVTLIEVLRDAWLVFREIDPVRATQIAKGWFALPYPSFKRLALYAASHDGSIPADVWVDWLLADDSRWLWSVNTKRETMRLLAQQGAHLTQDARARLEAAILVGPPREMYIDDIEPDWWSGHVVNSVWLLLAKLMTEEAPLNPSARAKLDDIPPGFSDWKIERKRERNEFSQWMSGTGDPDYEEMRDIDLAPRKRGELVKWLKQTPPSRRPFSEDTWCETCRTRFFHCAYALCDLAREGLWPVERWRDALQTWSEGVLILRSWQFIAPIVQTIPDAVLQEIAHGITRWMEAVSKLIGRHETILLDMCRRVLALSNQDGMDTDRPVTRAINHPIGHVATALLNLWFKREPNDNDMLPGDVEPFFTQLCDTRVVQFRHGRVLLASRLITLFRVDQPWTETHLLPLFDWTTNPTEARAVWDGFLWSPRLYRPLLIAFKVQFLDTAHHYAQLGDQGKQFARFLTYAALDPVDTYTIQDFQAAFGALAKQGLRESLRALVQVLEGAGEQREENWKNRIKPFWQHIWPKSRELASNGIAESLVLLSIAARGEFRSALSVVQDWLQPIEHPHYVVHRLHESRLAERFPEESLRLLNAILDNQSRVPRDLGECLAAISQASPGLIRDPRHQRLVEYSHIRGD